mgnify:CR=1 FL=1
MENFQYVNGYKSKLNFKDNELAIVEVRNYFESYLAKKLHLLRVTAPLFVLSQTGINDDLNGKEIPVNFNVIDFNNRIEIVHSLAKWKRYNISKYNLKMHHGIYTDMNAIRKDEFRDNYHSIYVDQWDYELLIKKKDRNLNFLKKYVKKIYSVIYKTEKHISNKYNLNRVLPKNITFITSEELLKKYPNLSNEERVNEYVKKVKALFLIGIGHKLSNGISQDGRAPDYDDWNLNGDIYVYNPILNNALELSSMGIRVDKNALLEQTKLSNKEYYLNFEYQRKILNNELPLTLGGGIGQSRICMFMLKKLHIGEVQASIWNDETRSFMQKHNVNIL